MSSPASRRSTPEITETPRLWLKKRSAPQSTGRRATRNDLELEPPNGSIGLDHSSLGRFYICALSREQRQQRIRLALLFRRLAEQRHRLGQPEFLSPALQRAKARDLVVLDGLLGRDQPCIERLDALELLENVVRLVQHALHDFAGLAACWLAQQFEDLLQAFDLSLGFGAMRVLSGREPFG